MLLVHSMPVYILYTLLFFYDPRSNDEGHVSLPVCLFLVLSITNKFRSIHICEHIPWSRTFWWYQNISIDHIPTLTFSIWIQVTVAVDMAFHIYILFVFSDTAL